MKNKITNFFCLMYLYFEGKNCQNFLTVYHNKCAFKIDLLLNILLINNIY